MKCEICYKECATAKILAEHIKHNHKNFTSKLYYDTFLKTDNDGICETCGNVTKYVSLGIGYKKFCSLKCVANNLAIKQKKINTCINKYGCDNPMQNTNIHQKTENTYFNKTGYKNPSNNPSVQQKRETTYLAKYGVKNPFQAESIKEKIKNYYIENFNCENVSQIPEIKIKKEQTNLYNRNTKFPAQDPSVQEKIKTTNLMKRNVPNVAQDPSVQEKIKNTLYKLYNVNNAFQIPEFLENNRMKVLEKYKKLSDEVLDFNYSYLTCKCEKCNNNYIIRDQIFQKRLLNNEIICNICNPYIKNYSKGEKELLNYIKTIYNGNILENNKTMLDGKEIDIYLPDLKVGFEFDGTYWHADPDFYTADFIIDNKTAKKIWERDAQKDQLAVSKNIKLYRIKENAWINNNSNVKMQIEDIINEYNNS